MAKAGVAADELDLAQVENAPDDWEELLAADPAADYNHTAHWSASAAAHHPATRTTWFTARVGGRLVGGAVGLLRQPRRWPQLARLESSLEGTSGGPLVAGDQTPARQEAVFRMLLDALLARRPRWPASVALALNPAHEERFGRLLADDRRWRRVALPTAVVDLAGGLEHVAAEKLVMNKRNERNRGLRRGAEVQATQDPALLATYYRLYAQACAHWGVPATPLAFLQALLADPQGRVFFTCVRLGERVIGGHLNLHFGDRVFAWNGVSDPAYARTHFPATLCFWGDMVEACRRGARWLDLGASGGRKTLSGFKRYFGAEIQTRGFYTADAPGLNCLRQLRQRALRRGVGAPGGRWHDGRTGERRRGGPA